MDNYPRNGALLRGVVHTIVRTHGHTSRGPGCGEKWLHVQEIQQADEEAEGEDRDIGFRSAPGPECWIMFEMKHGPVLFLLPADQST